MPAQLIKVFSYLLLPSFLCFFSFQSLGHFNCHQGIRGYVYRVSGNQMPSPDRPAPATKGIRTILYIYHLTNLRDVSRQGTSAFYTRIATELVKEVSTDDSGYFKVKLSPGLYSLFVKKDNLFFANRFDEKNNISPVEVKAGKMSEVVFTINYGATY
jgi:hypothetical protein